MKGLYIHIPFCHCLCKYCDFPKRINQKEELIKTYLEKLIKDLKKIPLSEADFDTVYIGGGTPNLLKDEELEEILMIIKKMPLKPNYEFTIEGNYELITKSQAFLFKKYGVNRISLGVETLNEEVGKRINRVSNFEVLKEKIKILKEANLTNINCDFIYGLPGETLSDVKKDLEKIEELNLKHLSFYSLILEDKSVLGYEVSKGLVELPDDDLVYQMGELIKERLEKLGFKHYEISNYAKAGFESKHNLLYWQLEDYLGIGMSAASFYKGKRFTNSRLIKDYLEDKNITYDEFESGEYFWLGLRMLDGVSLSGFQKRFKKDPFKTYPIKDLINEGLVTVNDDQIKLTKLGLDYGNFVFEHFI